MYSNEQFTTWKITKRETTVIITRPEANNCKPPQKKELMGDTPDEAVYCSWNNQKKEYQDEIRKLTNKVSKYCEKLDRIQSKLLSGDVNARRT